MRRLRTLIADRIRGTGPISVAEFMRLALYHPELGYYARASRPTGRTGDFVTNVDVGPLFGRLLARQFAQMWQVMTANQPDHAPFELVEVGAGNGQLARDVLDGALDAAPAFYAALRLRLVEVSPAARRVQPETLGPHAGKLASSSATLPDEVAGVIFANELLDALPTHVVVMRAEGLREVHVDVEDAGDGSERLVERELAPSTPALARYLVCAGARLEDGWRTEINLAAETWVGEAASALRRGFLVLIDYGHEATELYSAGHSQGTLTTFHRHTSGDAASWLVEPGRQDITSHVDLTTTTRTAEAAGLETLGRMDQTYFLMGLGGDGLVEETDGLQSLLGGRGSSSSRLAFKTLVWPGGLGSTCKVLVFGKGVGRPQLDGLAGGGRLT